MQERVLVIAAHPDDEVLGCGGTLALHRRAGHLVRVVIAAGRSEQESGYGCPQGALAARALAVLDVSDLVLLGLPDQRLDALPQLDLIQALEGQVKAFQPTVVLGHHGGDVNQDHRALFTAMLVATRPTWTSIRAVLAFEVASSTEWACPRTFAPDTYVDVADTLPLKLKALAEYGPELRAFPHPRSLAAVEHRARVRGSECCRAAAEAFMTVRSMHVPR